MPAPEISAPPMANAKLIQRAMPTTANVKRALLGNIANKVRIGQQNRRYLIVYWIK